MAGGGYNESESQTQESPFGYYADAMTALVHPIPVNIRMFLNNFREHPAPLRDEDLWKSDREAIRHATTESEKRDQKTHKWSWELPPGSIGYGDYGNETVTFESPSESVASILYNSFTNPAYRMETTLGKAKFRKDPSGQIEIKDAYDFKALPGVARQYIESHGGAVKSFIGAIADVGPLGPLNLLGGLVRPEGTGKPYTMTIPSNVGMDTHPREIAQTEPTDIPLKIRMAQRPEGPPQRTYSEKVAEITKVPMSQEDIGYAILEREQRAAGEQAARERAWYEQRPQYGIRQK